MKASVKTKESQLHGLKVGRWFSHPGVSPFDEVEWEKRSSVIAEPDGTVVFEMHDIEVPKGWSQLATDIITSKYFRKAGVPETGREVSVRQVVARVAHTLRVAGEERGYFATPADAETFEGELTHLLITQKGAFNSPVWFNCGLWHEYKITGSGGNWYWDPKGGSLKETPDAYSHPQCSACQPYDALVNTEEGMIPIGEIVTQNRIGLLVHDDKSTTKVLAVKANGRKPVYKITLQNGLSIRATGDHVVCATEDRRQEERWSRIDDLHPGMKMRVYPHRTPVPHPSGKDEGINIAEAALAGWLQADGFVGQYATGTNRSLTLEFMTVKEEEFQWVMKNIQACFPNSHYKVREVETQDKSLQCRRIRMYGDPLHNFVEKYGLLHRGLETQVPSSVWGASEEVVVAYLKSVFQAEGYVTTHFDEENGYENARVGMAVISREWVEGIQLLLMRLGIYSRMITKAEKRANRYDTHAIDIAYLSERRRFADTVGFISQDKAEKLTASLKLEGKHCPDLREESIVSIEPWGEMDVYDIQTESGRYLTHHVLVHNCFIQSVEDDLMSIFDLAKSEARLFKYGSGTGTNFSKIRGRQEKLSGGGTSSGLMSFLEVLDKGAGATKSGGTTRRAAKMVCLDIDHPEIVDFINWKVCEEKKAGILIQHGGFTSNFNGEAYHTVSGQNSNNSVRLTDDFMNATLRGDRWETRYRTTGGVCETFEARDLMRQIAQAAWSCADPGVQFDTTFNDWHTCSNTGRINATNPCSEYAFLDETACNLASLNLMKFVDSEGNFQVADFREAVRIFIIAQEIVVDFASYPTRTIAKNSYDYRPLGLGYANLGTLLMTSGIPYDSPKGRAIAAAITAIMTGHAYGVSAEIAGEVGPFAGFAKNREPMLRVMGKHRDAAYNIDARQCPAELLRAAREDWDEAIRLGEEQGYRNAQATVLAPTGTIGLLMDCDTTGVEPEFSLVKWKKLAGGGHFKIINQSIPRALARLGYTPKDVETIQQHILDKGTIEGAPGLKEEHLPIFDCANRGGDGVRFINPMGHVQMMAAVQPFISGAISKTINIPGDMTVEDVEKLYVESWKLGLKAVALYRDGSKHSQPLNTGSAGKEDGAKEVVSEPSEPRPVAEVRGTRKELPIKRRGFTVESSVRGHKIFLRTGEYNDGALGEIFIDMYKEGAAYRSLLNCFAIAISVGLQYGVPLEKFVNAFTFSRFDPQGVVDHPNIKFCTSILDFVFRVLGMEYLGRTDFVHLKPATIDEAPSTPSPVGAAAPTSVGAAAANEFGDAAPHQMGVIRGRAVSPPDLSEFKDASKQMGGRQGGERYLPPDFSEPSGLARDERMDEHLAEMMGDAPLCDLCGHVTVRNGACYKCINCGNSMGCS